MLNELEHAWVMTVHKSQGSEYRAVVLCIGKAGPMLLTRSVLYTAITRAKSCSSSSATRVWLII